MTKKAFGAVPDRDGTLFRLWAPAARRVTLELETGPAAGGYPLQRGADGISTTFVPGARAGDRYRYRIDNGVPVPDPASRFQPEGVHGPSEIVDPAGFAWSDAGWTGVDRDDLAIYELHVGTFTDRGTFAGAAERLPYLRDLGVTAIELMPIADFPGARNWGYDGVALFAPSRAYGRPDDLRRLVDAAHAHGLAVLLDAVYNHLGPDGASIAVVSPPFFSSLHMSPWGPAINLDGPGSEYVRAFLIENARHWIQEYHLDGFRLDATHAIVDDSARHFLEELTAAVHRAGRGRRTIVIAEDARNIAAMVRDADRGGWGMDGVWADDFHHEMRRLLAGDIAGYYVDYRGSVEDLATNVRDGWLFRGQASVHFGAPRGTDPSGIHPRRFVFFLQNHDQVGNRARGDRLSHDVDLSSCRAAAVVLLAAPQTPLLFMGEEWAASTPFLFFTDHEPGLGRLVTEGRRNEYGHFATSAVHADQIPDPQSPDTFAASRLRWHERENGDHGGMLRLYRTLLHLRREAAPLCHVGSGSYDAWPLDEHTIAVRRSAPEGSTMVIVARLRGAGEVIVSRGVLETGEGRQADWKVVLTTEDQAFAPDPAPLTLRVSHDEARILFRRPSAVILARS